MPSVAAADNLGSHFNATLSGVRAVDGAAHTYGVQIVGGTDEGGTPNRCAMPAGRFTVTVKDV